MGFEIFSIFNLPEDEKNNGNGNDTPEDGHNKK